MPLPVGPVLRACTAAVAGRLRNRAWPALMTVLLLAVGMAFCTWWEPVVRHKAIWIVPGDIWGTFRSAHFIGWGDLGDVYSAGTGLVSFPGILLVLAPVAMLCNALGLSESFPFTLPHPTAWLVLGPVSILVSCSALFACDALAERLGAGTWRRALIAVAGAAGLWNVAVLWGHPEDALAVALAVYALTLAIDGRWSGAGWLFGAAVATQPLVLLMLPVLLAMAGRRAAGGLVLRSLGPAGLLLATPLLAQFHTTGRALFEQPNFPNLDHATPWTALAPKLGGHGISLAVAAGPGRIVAVLLACALGLWARKWRLDPVRMVWAAGVAMALRCLTESVLDPYYVWPAVALGLAAASRSWAPRLVAAACLVVAVTAVSDSHLGLWPWWTAVNGSMVAVLALGLDSHRKHLIRAHALNVEARGADDRMGALVPALRA